VPASEIAYELDALLAAIRSSIDFSARVLGLHLGMDRRISVTKVLNVVKTTPNHPFSFLLGWASWIGSIKRYRDECTHYRALRLQTGYEAIQRHGVLASTLRPVVIPLVHGNDQPETRMDQIMYYPLEYPVGLDRSHGSTTVRAQDGTIERFEHSVEYTPADGYILVEQFSSRNVRRLENFLTAVLTEASKAKFTFQPST
jgi:hypothetical protein